MIYLRTGANGSCKTLFTLKDVRDLQLASGRPVCINGRFKIKQDKLLEFGWRVIDFKDWQAEPDGTIFLIDECHNDLPVRPSSAPVPEPVRMLAEHRARGFDFFLLTQHPMNIDPFVRKLIGAPGWHQHLKRVFGGTSVTRVLQWDAVRVDCEKDGSGKSAEIVTRAQPKEVFQWYDSATLHTAKTRIPKRLWVIVGAIVLVPLCFYFAFSKLAGPKSPVSASSSVPGASGVPGQRPAVAPASLSASDYVNTFEPRVQGLPYTAPRYDDVTKAVVAPYPAACVSMGDRCSCYTQQGTKLETPLALCKNIVSNGFFMDWQASPLNASNPDQNGQRTPIQGNPGASPAVSPPSPPAPVRVADASQTQLVAATHVLRPPVTSH